MEYADVQLIKITKPVNPAPTSFAGFRPPGVYATSTPRFCFFKEVLQEVLHHLILRVLSRRSTFIISFKSCKNRFESSALGASIIQNALEIYFLYKSIPGTIIEIFSYLQKSGYSMMKNTVTLLKHVIKTAMPRVETTQSDINPLFLSVHKSEAQYRWLKRSDVLRF